MEASTEEWRPVLGYEGLYEVSDQGKVRSVDRIIDVARRSCRYRRELRGRMIRLGFSLSASSRERPIVSLNRGGKKGTFFVHRLVLEAFVGLRPEGLECCHGDGDPMNNRLGNLRWDTHVSNVEDQRLHGTMALGERNGNAKLTADDVREIRRRYSMGGVTLTALGLEYGVSRPNVSSVIDRSTWAWVS